MTRTEQFKMVRALAMKNDRQWRKTQGWPKRNFRINPLTSGELCDATRELGFRA